MREGEDKEIRARDLDWRAPEDEIVHCISPAFQWLPRGICQESAFNRFVLRKSHEKAIHSPSALILKKTNDFKYCSELFASV